MIETYDTWLDWEILGMNLGVSRTQVYRHSKIFYCTQCGRRYGQVHVKVNGYKQPYSAVPGCCLDCSPNWSQVPGALPYDPDRDRESPPAVMLHQFWCEFHFLSHPSYPGDPEWKTQLNLLSYYPEPMSYSWDQAEPARPIPSGL